MNPDYGYEDDEAAYEDGLIKAGQDRARRNLAAILTNLRKEVSGNPDKANRDGYIAALDAVAKKNHITTVTEVRYNA